LVGVLVGVGVFVGVAGGGQYINLADKELSFIVNTYSQPIEFVRITPKSGITFPKKTESSKYTTSPDTVLLIQLSIKSK